MPLDALALPVVNAVLPPTGPEGGGTSVTIQGTGFTGALGVYFGYNANNQQAITSVVFTVVSDTEITCTSPESTLPDTFVCSRTHRPPCTILPMAARP